MLRRRFYYALKPFLPWSLRMAIRRIAAQRKLASCRDTWPINEAAGHTPAGWPGWPDGKHFAVVLTHDVEGPEGLAKCRRLSALEKSLGFRSSFNFIPEGAYRVPSEIRHQLQRDGFEVGVHDLKHDGKLFRSHDDFRKKAARINRYVREWNARGYRSGFMLRNLDWLHALDVHYDSSTFDTDPFEPQSDGVNTIFPFWIPASAVENTRARNTPLPFESRQPVVVPKGRTGYVELPYTLPQDSTLFLVLRESSPEIWLRKLEWIAQRGGMVLVNVHPDYVRFPDEPATSRTYPVEHYIRFLEHLRRTYAGRFWPALPAEVADFTLGIDRRPTMRTPKRICMVTHSFYESDNRVTRYAEALAARGDHVDVLALRQSPGLPKQEIIEGVRLFRIQDRFGKTERSRIAYLWPMVRFLAVSCWWVARRHMQRGYDLLHVHNMPDFLVFAGWYPRLQGAKIILDIHDIVPEFYASKFRGGQLTLSTRMLKLVERRSARLAHHIIISNHLWLEKYAMRTSTADKCSVFINNVDSKVFKPKVRTRSDDRLIVLFPGGLQWHQGLDIALYAFSQVGARLPQAEFHIYGDGNMKPQLRALSQKLTLDGKVKFFDSVGVRAISRIMADADLGVVPKRADSFGNEAYSTKIMEFMSLGIPVVVSSTKIDRYYFNDSVVRFFESGNVDALAEAMVEILTNRQVREQLIANALAYAARHSWSIRKADYLRITDGLINEGAATPFLRAEAESSTDTQASSFAVAEVPDCSG